MGEYNHVSLFKRRLFEIVKVVTLIRHSGPRENVILRENEQLAGVRMWLDSHHSRSNDQLVLVSFSGKLVKLAVETVDVDSRGIGLQLDFETYFTRSPYTF